MDERKYQEAKKRVKAKKEFFEHLSTYLVMGGFFFFLNAITSFGRWWFFWPMLGWGIGVMFHYISVFGVPGVGQLDQEWEQRAIQKELERMGNLPLKEDTPKRQAQVEEEPEENLDLKPLEKRIERKWNDEDLV